MESIGQTINKQFGKSLLYFMKLVDPERKYNFAPETIKAWNALTLVEQQKLYLYLLYRKWRGIDIYGEPYYIIKNCHPVPFDWNGHNGINRLAKEGRLVFAKYQGSYGTYTRDEAKIYGMTDVKPLN